MRTRLAIVCVCLSLWTAGCYGFGKGRYPATWPALDTRTTCAQLAGRYRDAGDMPYQSKFLGKSLTALLLNGISDVVDFRGRISSPASGDGPEWQVAEFVTFSFPHSDQVRITLSNAQQAELLTRTFATGQYSCKGRIVTLRKSARWGGGVAPPLVPGVFHESAFLDLYPFENALIVKERIRTAGVIAVIPFKGTSSTWYRFERVPDAVTPYR